MDYWRVKAGESFAVGERTVVYLGAVDSYGAGLFDLGDGQRVVLKSGQYRIVGDREFKVVRGQRMGRVLVVILDQGESIRDAELSSRTARQTKEWDAWKLASRNDRLQLAGVA